MLVFVTSAILAFILALVFVLYKHEGLFSPLIQFVLYMGLYYAVAPAYSILFYRAQYSSGAVLSSAMTVLLTLGYYACMERFRVFGRIALWTRELGYHVETNLGVVKRRVAIGFFLGFGLYVASIYLVYGGSFAEVFANPLRFRLEMGKGMKTLLYGLQIQLMYTFFFGYIAYRYRTGRKPYTLGVKVHAVLLTLLSFCYGSRGILIGFFVQALIIHEIFTKRVLLKRLAVAGVCAILLFAGYLQYRNTANSGQSPLERLVSSFRIGPNTVSQILDSIITRADALGNFDVYINALDNGSLEIEPFTSFVGAPQQFIPRDFYPDKPYYFSSEMTRRLLPDVFAGGATYDFTGIAEWIHNFNFGTLPLFPLLPAFVMGLAQACYRKGDPFISYFFIYNLLAGLPIAIVNNGFLNTSNVIWLPLPTVIYFTMLMAFLKRSAPVVLIRPTKHANVSI